MNIILSGYGKMGKAIERIAISRGHKIVLILDAKWKIEDLENCQNADVAIEFSSPEAAFNNISHILKQQIPVVCGTTGWLDKLEDAKQICNTVDTALLYASNFSIGVNIFFEINQKLASLMNQYSQYQVSMEEIHHIHKLDAPSGTALTLANDILNEITRLNDWEKGATNDITTIGIESKREGEVPGTHIVRYSSSIDTIEISHTAHSREGFAWGAVIAAEWLVGKKGFFEMKDVLKNA